MIFKRLPLRRIHSTQQSFYTCHFLQVLVLPKQRYNATEKTDSEIETKKETENRGSAVPLHEAGYPLKLDALLS